MGPTLLCYTAVVLLAPGAYPGLLRPLPAYAGTVCSTEQVGDPCSHVPVNGDERHEVHVGLPHMTRRNHERCDGAVPPARPAGARFPIPRAESSSEDQVQLESSKAETQAVGLKGRGERISLV